MFVFEVKREHFGITLVSKRVAHGKEQDLSPSKEQIKIVRKIQLKMAFDLKRFREIAEFRNDSFQAKKTSPRLKRRILNGQVVDKPFRRFLFIKYFGTVRKFLG